MLATAGPVPSGPGWSVEFKWDGMRTLVSVSGERRRVLTRTGREVTGQFPELEVLPVLLDGRQVTLDGELVTLDAAGVPDFARLQRRMLVHRPAPALLRQVPISLYVFDLLFLDGEPLTRRPYAQRRALLDGLDLAGPVVTVPPAFADAAAEVYAAAAERGLEGVVAKRLDSRYEPGRRSKAWVKTVIPHLAEVVVCGWLPGQGRLAGSIGALLVAAYDPAGHLRYVGRVGSGLSGTERAALLQRLDPIRRRTSPMPAEASVMAGARWVEPVLVARVKYRTWTAGHLLRHPVYQGVLDDRTADVVALPDPPMP